MTDPHDTIGAELVVDYARTIGRTRGIVKQAPGGRAFLAGCYRTLVLFARLEGVDGSAIRAALAEGTAAAVEAAAEALAAVRLADGVSTGDDSRPAPSTEAASKASTHASKASTCQRPGCDRPLVGRSHRRWCSASCRTLACRARQAVPVLHEREGGRR